MWVGGNDEGVEGTWRWGWKSNSFQHLSTYRRDTAHNKKAEFVFSSDGQTARLGNLRSGTGRDVGEDWKIENCQSYQNCRYEYIYASSGNFCFYRWGNQPDSNGGANEDCLQFYWSKRDRWSITYSLLIINNGGWWNELCILFLFTSLAVFFFRDGWHDVDCSYKQRYICSKRLCNGGG